MAQSLSNILIHIVFSTKERRQWIYPEIETQLYGYIKGICFNLSCPVHQIGGISDHIHLLISLLRTMSIGKLVADIKANSSRWMKLQDHRLYAFTWQAGYGAFSIGQSAFEDVVDYIKNQKEHHKKRFFEEEFKILLDRYKILYDENYLWD